MIVVLHILEYGGVIEATSKLSINYVIGNTLLILVYPGVNCFALVSGYVGIDVQSKLRKSILLYFNVLFYSVVLSVLGLTFRNGTMIDVVKGFFPLLTRRYWYFSAYFGLLVCMPLLNLAMKTFSRKQMKIAIFMMISSISISQTLFRIDAFNASSGYSMLWLCIMYMCGAYIKQYDCFSNASSYKVLATMCISALFTLFVKLMIEMVGKTFLEYNGGGGLLILYVSPTIVIQAVCLVLLFARLSIKNGGVKVIKQIAPLAFGVYLIHTHPTVFQIFFSGFYTPLGSSAIMLPKVLGAATVVFVICLMIEYGRIKLFSTVVFQGIFDKVETRIRKWRE